MSYDDDDDDDDDKYYYTSVKFCKALQLGKI